MNNPSYFNSSPFERTRLNIANLQWNYSCSAGIGNENAIDLAAHLSLTAGITDVTFMKALSVQTVTEPQKRVRAS
jgi:hypothetical protein